jgi:hypothetical protein
MNFDFYQNSFKDLVSTDNIHRTIYKQKKCINIHRYKKKNDDITTDDDEI